MSGSPNVSDVKDYFTFHNVSIKTVNKKKSAGKVDTLHSTMFLLKLGLTDIKKIFGLTLHSTMFLLKPDRIGTSRTNIAFTFHNVSIKTGIATAVKNYKTSFTFHNVSIKTPPSTHPHKINLILAHFVDLVLFLLEMIRILFFYYENGVFAGFWRIVDLPVFETHRISTEIREKNWYSHLLVPKILYPTISPVLI